MGVLTFIVSTYQSKEDENEEKYGWEIAKLSPEEKQKYEFKYFGVHISKGILDRCAEIENNGEEGLYKISHFKEGGKEFLSQMLIHECTERFIPPFKGIIN